MSEFKYKTLPDGRHEIVKLVPTARCFDKLDKAMAWALDSTTVERLAPPVREPAASERVPPVRTAPAGHDVQEGAVPGRQEAVPVTPRLGSGLAADPPCSLRSRILLETGPESDAFLFIKEEGEKGKVLFGSMAPMTVKDAAENLHMTWNTLYHRLTREPRLTMREVLRPHVTRTRPGNSKTIPLPGGPE